MQIVRWHLAATASAEASTDAPTATSGATLAGLMSYTTSSNPALTRLSAIGPPILPSPIKPTVPVIGFLLSDRGDRSTRLPWVSSLNIRRQTSVQPELFRAGTKLPRRGSEQDCRRLSAEPEMLRDGARGLCSGTPGTRPRARGTRLWRPKQF